MENLSIVLKQRRKELGLTLAQIAEQMGVAEATVQRWESGNIKSIRYEKIDRLADVLKVNPASFMGWEESIEPLPSNIHVLEPMDKIPLIGRIACGTPILAEENIEDYVDLPRHIKADFALTCRGDSMVNAGIRDGDVVYIRKQEHVENGQIAAVRVGDDEATLKRFYYDGESVRLVAENPSCPTKHFFGQEMAQVHVIGLVMGYTHAIENNCRPLAAKGERENVIVSRRSWDCIVPDIRYSAGSPSSDRQESGISGDRAWRINRAASRWRLLFTISENGTLPKANKSNSQAPLTVDTDQVKQPPKNNTEKEESNFEGLLVVDNDECVIDVVGIDEDGTWGYTLKAKLENKSSDKVYMFSVTSAAINGVQCDPFFAKEVAAGKKTNSEISFSKSDLERVGTPTDIELFFRVYDSNDWDSENVAEEHVHIYPYGEENASKFNRIGRESDVVIADNEYIRATVTGNEYDPIWGYTVNLFLENKSEMEIMFSVDNASVNGYMLDPFWAKSVLPGMCAFSSMSWSDTAFDETGIEEVSDIEFLFKAYDSNNWTSDQFFEEIVTLNP